MINLKQPRKETQRTELCLLGEKCGTLLLTVSRQSVYTADLKTGKMQKVLDWPRSRLINPSDVVPLEMDWAAVFVSRLGTRYS
jgi:hypothetical protein